MPGIEIDFGIDLRAMKEFLERHPDQVKAAIARAIHGAAESAMALAKAEYVPVVTGTLRSSGYVKDPEWGVNEVTVELGFGGAAAPYALYVHEAPPDWGQGKNKYLEKPVIEIGRRIESRLLVELRREFGR